METLEINRFSPNGETRLTENQGVTKLPDLDKWTYSKITTSPKPLVKLPNPISEQFLQISSTTVLSLKFEMQRFQNRKRSIKNRFW